MTKEQLQTRVKWFLKELKEYHVIPSDIELDTRLIAIRSAKHVLNRIYFCFLMILKNIKNEIFLFK